MTNTTLVNLTPHPIVVRLFCEGEFLRDNPIEPSGSVARVSSTPGNRVSEIDFGHHDGAPVAVAIHAAPTWGDVEGLPAPEAGTVFIVSAMVAARCIGRRDVVSPGTGPNDGAVRDESGRIVAVTCFVRAPEAEPEDDEFSASERAAGAREEAGYMAAGGVWRP